MIKKCFASILAMVVLIFCIPISAFASNGNSWIKALQTYKTLEDSNRVITTTEFESLMSHIF
ncbi:MAG: hypothetical protein IKD76_00315 [Clostridia bacterium]|nr:hypothetical protein [Clostridia bacterium]